MYGDFGIIFVHSRIPSPVPEWDGMSESGAGGQATLGWEWRPWRVVVRTSLGFALGEGGLAPFLGFAVGARLLWRRDDRRVVGAGGSRAAIRSRTRA